MKFIKNNLIYIIFMILPIIDILTSFNVRYNVFIISPGIIVRGFILLYSLFYVIKSKNKYKNIYLLLLFIYFVIYVLIRLFLSAKVNFYVESTTFFKFWYFPVLLIFLNTYPINQKKMNFALEINTFIYILGIFIPLLSHSYFSSYNSSYKGIVGWYYSANELGNLLSINLYLLYLNLNKKNMILIILSILALSFIGTKVSLFSIIIITISTFIVFVFKDKKSKKTFYSLLVILITVFIITFNNTSYDVFKRLDTSENKIFEIKKENYYYKIDKILSGRFTFLLNTRKDYKCERNIIKLFGLGFSYNNLKSIEIDTFDILYRYGIIGTIIYFFPFSFYLYCFIKEKNRLNTSSIICFLAIFLAFSICGISGHVLSAPTASIYVSISIALLNLKKM